MSDPFVTLICETCECVYAVYKPTMDEVEDPECSSCSVDRAFRPLEEAVANHRRLVERHRRETRQRIWNAPKEV